MKLSTIAAVAIAGTLAACGKAQESQGPASQLNMVDAVQGIGEYQSAVEFTPKTNPNKQCVAIVGLGGGYAGGITCWDKTPSP